MPLFQPHLLENTYLHMPTTVQLTRLLVLTHIKVNLLLIKLQREFSERKKKDQKKKEKKVYLFDCPSHVMTLS